MKKLCKCGCGEHNKTGCWKRGHFNKNKKRSVETCNKISKSLKGFKHTKESKNKISKNNARYMLEKKMSDESKRKMSVAAKNCLKDKRNHPNFGKKFSTKLKEKLSLSHKGACAKEKHPNWGKHLSFEIRRKIGEAQKGNKSHAWKGGISKLPYNFNWTDTLKESIRQRDSYCCRLCGVKSGSKFHSKLDVHHIDYDKDNINPNYLISLCKSCHTKTNFNRDKWFKFFNKMLRIKVRVIK
tara:strand:- start:2052 stop:2771 length:720 start_codon:yes stop_codon:yes gene_type:complete